jgi:putative tricarboxylic transport membrane protein
MFDAIFNAFLMVFTVKGILHLILGGVIGLAIGILPGLGPVFGVALFLPFTFWMPPHLGLVFLASLYACCVYGGSITAVLLGIPGTPGSITTVFDGYELSKKGKAGVSLGLSVTSSMLGGIIGVIALALFAPMLAEFALKFAPADYFALAFFGLSMVAVAARGDTLRGLMLGILGVLISTMGVDLFTGDYRFTFGVEYLEGGIPFIPVAIGLFALSQAFILAEEGGQISRPGRITGGVREGVVLVLKHWTTVLKNGVLGSILGAIPGVGINITNFLAYMFQKRGSRDPDSFGRGNPLGVVAPETANNACVSAELIPAFALGIPGGATAAIFLAAINIYGLRPGYEFFSEAGAIAYALILGLFFAQFLFFLIGIFGANYFAKVTLVPAAILVPTIMALSFIGGVADRSLFTDVIVVVIFGVFGYICHKNRYPIACLILGLILGPLVERNFTRSLQMSDGSFTIFVSSPISIILWVMTIGALAYGVLPHREWFGRVKRRFSD